MLSNTLFQVQARAPSEVGVRGGWCAAGDQEIFRGLVFSSLCTCWWLVGVTVLEMPSAAGHRMKDKSGLKDLPNNVSSISLV